MDRFLDFPVRDLGLGEDRVGKDFHEATGRLAESVERQLATWQASPMATVNFSAIDYCFLFILRVGSFSAGGGS